MTTHLGTKNAPEGRNTGNSRNGKSTKQVKADFGEAEIEVPRARNGEFEPQLVKKKGNAACPASTRKLSPCTRVE
jgi:transposase-like protein